MPVIGQQFHAERVNRSEECAVECIHHFGRKFFFEDLLPGALLHLVRRAIREGHDHETRQDLSRISRPRDLQNAVRDCARLTRSGGSHHGKIPVEFIGESTPIGLIAWLFHQ